MVLPMKSCWKNVISDVVFFYLISENGGKQYFTAPPSPDGLG